MKILNLYAGIGGNRRLWGDDHTITSVEIVPEIAAIYSDFFPQDELIVGDAHEYLIKHFREYDFIWSSPPCPTHSRINFMNHMQAKPRYPDMKLYEEILLLKHWYKGKWVIENVKSYYNPLIPPIETDRHYFWTNFHFSGRTFSNKMVRNSAGVTLLAKMAAHAIEITDWHGYKGDKRTLINNMIESELGSHIFEAAQKTTVQGALNV